MTITLENRHKLRHVRMHGGRYVIFKDGRRRAVVLEQAGSRVAARNYARIHYPRLRVGWRLRVLDLDGMVDLYFDDIPREAKSSYRSWGERLRAYLS